MWQALFFLFLPLSARTICLPAISRVGPCVCSSLLCLWLFMMIVFSQAVTNLAAGKLEHSRGDRALSCRHEHRQQVYSHQSGRRVGSPGGFKTCVSPVTCTSTALIGRVRVGVRMYAYMRAREPMCGCECALGPGGVRDLDTDVLTYYLKPVYPCPGAQPPRMWLSPTDFAMIVCARLQPDGQICLAAA